MTDEDMKTLARMAAEISRKRMALEADEKAMMKFANGLVDPPDNIRTARVMLAEAYHSDMATHMLITRAGREAFGPDYMVALGR